MDFATDAVAAAPLDAGSIYLASPWFNESQLYRMQAVLSLLKEWRDYNPNRSIFSPYEEFICPPDASKSVRRSTYDGNLKAIMECDILVAVTDEKDVGTIFEAGYAAHTRDSRWTNISQYSPILVGVALSLPKGATFNLMLAEGFDVICTSLEQLHEYLFEGVIPEYSNPVE